MITTQHTLNDILQMTTEVGEDWAIARICLERMEISLGWLNEESFGVL